VLACYCQTSIAITPLRLYFTGGLHNKPIQISIDKLLDVLRRFINKSLPRLLTRPGAVRGNNQIGDITT
jgi:hypothetical protein